MKKCPNCGTKVNRRPWGCPATKCPDCGMWWEFGGLEGAANTEVNAHACTPDTNAGNKLNAALYHLESTLGNTK